MLIISFITSDVNSITYKEDIHETIIKKPATA